MDSPMVVVLCMIGGWLLFLLPRILRVVRETGIVYYETLFLVLLYCLAWAFLAWVVLVPDL